MEPETDSDHSNHRRDLGCASSSPQYANAIISLPQLPIRRPIVQSKPWHIVVAAATLALGASLASVGCRETPVGPQTGIETVVVAPTAARVVVSDTLRFSAVVTGLNPNHAVRWSAAWGTIDSSGLYLAPASPGADTVKAVSVVDSTKTGRTPVAIITGIDAVTIAPTSPTIVTGDSLRFAATVTGLNTNRTVRWSASRGTIDSSGLYLAPASPGADTVKAVSVVDSTKLATVLVTITNQPMLRWKYHPAGVGRARIDGIVLDRDENVIIAGTLCCSPQREIVLSLDSTGRHRWTVSLSQESSAWGLVLLPDLRSVAVAGSLGPAPLLLVLDSAGRKQSEQTCPLVNDGVFIDIARGNDRIYMAGWPPDAIRTSDVSGNIDCAQPIQGAVDDLAARLLSGVELLGNSLVVGGDRNMSNACWSSGLYPFVQAIDGSTEPLWRLDFDSIVGPGTSTDYPRIAAGTESGQQVIYVTVATNGCGQGSNYLTGRLNSQGRPTWVNRWNEDGASACEAYPYTVVPDARGGAVVVGMGTPDCLSDWHCVAISYNVDGTTRWSMRPTIITDGNNMCEAAAMSANGRHLYVTGGTIDANRVWDIFVAKYALPQ